MCCRNHRVRSIGPEWRDLAGGLLRSEALEARFRAEWDSRLEEARRKRNEAELRRLTAKIIIVDPEGRRG